MTAPLKLCVRRTDLVTSAGPAVEVSVVLPSDVRYIEESVELMARHCFAGYQASSRLRFRLQVTLSEALANAIICGNGQDPDKHVSIRAHSAPDHIELVVTDEGVGFDPDRVAPSGATEVESQCGRGLYLIRHLADRVAYNAEGNSICITLGRHP
jgi:serine/threonine-protein kinase RsbW